MTKPGRQGGPSGWNLAGRAAVAVAVALLAADAALGAPAAREPAMPNYAIPYLAGLVMCVTLLAIPCKRFRRS